MWQGATDVLPEFDLLPPRTALLVVDLQYLDAHPDYGMGRSARESGVAERFSDYFQAIQEMLPRVKILRDACRKHGIEVIYTVISSHVYDCRDVGLQHRRVKLLAPAGSKEAQILAEIAPTDNELVLKKGTSSAFNGTAIDQILRNMGIETLIVAGVATNYCVESAVRDASDRNYNVILVSDACAAVTFEDHAFALRILHNTYCKVLTTEQVLASIESAATRNTGETDG